MVKFPLAGPKQDCASAVIVFSVPPPSGGGIPSPPPTRGELKLHPAASKRQVTRIGRLYCEAAQHLHRDALCTYRTRAAAITQLRIRSV
jgi:hypothetical protein